ncbi:MAG: Hsp33 family molecular chaperone HslO [Clostridiales bacterium]|jgi:molecular chaperone Hsp33|nr:Hsp33 family molecular chaperone HslO [Clostridiales bacterium]
MSFSARYILNGAFVVTVIDSKDVADEAARLHGLPPLYSAALNRLLTVGVFLSQDLKSPFDRLSLTVETDGPIKRAVVAAKSGGLVKGYLVTDGGGEPTNAAGGGGLDVSAAFGKSGRIRVIKDLGMREPYVGNSEVVRGDIASDFALYLTVSEQRPSGIAMGEYFDGRSILSASGIFVQALPGADDFLITAVQDVLTRFTDVGKILYSLKTADAVMSEYFGAFEFKKIDEYVPRYLCDCSEERVKEIILALGRDEAAATIKEVGKIEVKCSFCEKNYSYTDIGEIF